MVKDQKVKILKFKGQWLLVRKSNVNRSKSQSSRRQSLKSHDIKKSKKSKGQEAHCSKGKNVNRSKGHFSKR